MNKVDVLKKAKSLIEKPSKWHKGYYYKKAFNDNPDYSCLCSLGAVANAIDSNCYEPFTLGFEYGTWNEIRRELSETVSEFTDENINHIARFNDRPETTHEDVMNIFDATIKRLSEDE